MFSKRILICFSLLILTCCQAIAEEKTILADDLLDKVRGMWLGQLIGNNAGRSTEGQYSYSLPNPSESVPWVIKQEWDADDDTDIEYIALHILETNGFNCSSQDLRSQWMEHITLSGIYISNRQALYLMWDGYLPPETGSRSHNMHWFSIDSQITTEVLGAISPGMPQQAIDITGKFAHMSNEGFPAHAAQLYAAMYSNAFFESELDPNVVSIVTEGLKAIPISSRTYTVANDVLQWYLEDAIDGQLDWRSTRKKLYDYYEGLYDNGRYYHWIESTVNTGATILSLLYGGGDFKETIQIGVLAGWDCDCNPATTAGLIGLIKGYSGLPADLTDPAICGDVYKNVYRPYLPDENLVLPQYDTISNIAQRIADLAEQNILANGGYVTGTDSTRTFHIPMQSGLITEPEKPNPTGPSALVADAIDAGLTVTASAAIEYHLSNDDRRNLDAVIDGIADNSYNGHKAYYSYTSSSTKPEKDWYQLNFSEPVKFDGATFYEGDFLWSRINDYCKTQQARGGFFEDISVEIFKNGKYVTPANLTQDTALIPYEMYQRIGFTFAPTVGTSIRIIGRAGGSDQFTTIMELEAQGNIETGLYITDVQINDGHVQRSDVSDIKVIFSEEVNILPNSFNIVNKSTGTVLNKEHINVVYSNSSYQTTLTFDMDFDGDFSDSLPDDIYELRTICSNITNSQQQSLLDDDSNPEDGYYSVDFHRLFGDADGSARVDYQDFSILSSVWLDSPSLTGLDFNGDGVVQFTDLMAFSYNWLDSLH